MNNKIIIISTAFFLLISFVFLSVIEKKQADINTKDVWMVYFENPKDDSLSFVIENHSNDTNFHWQISSDKTTTNQGDVTIKNGKTKKIPVSNAGIKNKKITISITSGDSTKEIYKGL